MGLDIEQQRAPFVVNKNMYTKHALDANKNYMIFSSSFEFFKRDISVTYIFNKFLILYSP